MAEYITSWAVGIDGELTFAYGTKEQIVRCRECRFAVEDAEWCRFEHETLGVMWRRVKPEGFCAWGERNG